MRWIRALLMFIGRCVLLLRYRVKVVGTEQLKGIAGPILITPNHPGLIDPPLVITHLWPWLQPRPMVYENNFNNPVLYPLIGLLNAVKVPDLEQASAKAKERAGEALTAVIEGLRQGETHILWPAGRLQRTGVEKVGSARALADILAAVPNVTVVRVRTRGVWGSMFSVAQTGKTPELLKLLLVAVGLLIANLILFAPRRRVTITVQRVDPANIPERRREVLNPWFESFANVGSPEEPTFVPYHFASRQKSFDFPKPPSLAMADLSQVKPAIKAAIAEMIAEKLKRPLTAEENKPDQALDTLGMDSLDRMELTLHVEQRFGFTGDQVPATIGDLWVLAQGLGERTEAKPPPAEWFRPVKEEGPAEILGETVGAAFIARALKCRQDVALADDLAGVLTYERLLVGVRTMSRRVAEMPGENIGVMLPASVAGDVAFLAVSLAGKLPILLNWTTGPTNLAHAAKLMDLKRVITSRAFVDRAHIAPIAEGVEFVYLEDLRKTIGKLELFRTLMAVKLGRAGSWAAPVEPNKPAMVLFTSGSEKAPKAVPLTHINLLTLMRNGIPILELKRSDSVLGFLPAFHSFGIVVTGLLPLLSGMRVVHHPDPTDAGGLVRKITAYKPTFMAGTPTFVAYILDRGESQPGALESLRLVAVGAEKCPPAVFERFAQQAPRAILLEGYGITECSPVVSANRPNRNKPGSLGLPLPCVSWRIVDLETDKPLPAGKMGMLQVAGPTIFNGYLGYDGPSPFVEAEGKRWYVTGDLAEADSEGFLYFRGRLKRFLKAGGEMISLPALEEPFVKRYPPTQEGPRVAVEGLEDEAGRKIVLFTTQPLSLQEANAILVAEGMRGVMRFDEVRMVSSIPVLGTGKTDYKVLRAMIRG